MRAIVIDTIILIGMILLALIPTDSLSLFWISWFAVVACIVFLCIDIYRYRQPIQ